MARYLNKADLLDDCRKNNRKVDVKVEINWHGGEEGSFDEIESVDDDFLNLRINRQVEGDLGKSIRDIGILELDNSNGDYSPKNLASRFNFSENELINYNIVPNRYALVSLSINGSDYFPYFSGYVTRIVPNFNDSKVSIDIDDPMSVLQHSDPPDKLYNNVRADSVIEEMLKDTPIFNYDIPNISDRITYNFKSLNNRYEVLQMIAEMVWGYFYTSDNVFYFKKASELKNNIIEEIDGEDDVFQIKEDFNSDDLYTHIQIESEPYFKQNQRVVWTGAEDENDITEIYSGSDISNYELQLVYTPSGSTTQQPTNNVPIVPHSVTVEFGEQEYTEGFGITEVDYNTGLIKFDSDFPMPTDVEEVSVTYSYYMNILAPGQTRTIYADLDHPTFNVPKITGEGVSGYSLAVKTTEGQTIETDSEVQGFSDIELEEGTGASPREAWITIDTSDEDIKDFQLEFDYIKYSYTDWAILPVTESRRNDLDVELYINGEYIETLYNKRGNVRNERTISTDWINAEHEQQIEIRFLFTFLGEDTKSACFVENLNANIRRRWEEGQEDRSGSVSVYQKTYDDMKRVKLIFANQGNEQVVLRSVYNGRERDTLLLLGEPLEQPKHFNINKIDDDADIAFRGRGSKLEIRNNLFRSEGRMKRIADFLSHHYSTPKSKLNINMNGLIHLELFDRIYLTQEHRDIDNEFIIYGLEDIFNENGRWEQNIQLQQAEKSAWEYQEDGTPVIVVDGSTVPTDDEDAVSSPTSVSNLNLDIIPLKTDDDSSFPAIKATYNMDETTTRIANIYYRSLPDGEWRLYERTFLNESIIDEIRSTGEYEIKVQSESHDGILEDFEDSPSATIEYLIDELNIAWDSINLLESRKQLKDGTILSNMIIYWDVPAYAFYNATNIFIRSEDEEEWNNVGKAKNSPYETNALEHKRYYVKLVAEDKWENRVDFELAPSASIEIDGKVDSPLPINWEEIVWKADHIKLNWEMNNESDFDEYEIRKDPHFGIEEEL